MKLAVIQVHDKSNRIKKDFALTDENPAAVFEKVDNKIVLQDNWDCILAENPVKFMSVVDVLEEYIRQEITWLQEPELVKQMDKCISMFKKIEGKANDATYEKSQQQIEWGLKTLNIPVAEEKGKIDPLTGSAVTIAEEDWIAVCKTAYRYAAECKEKNATLDAMRAEGFREPYYSDIALVYLDFINGTHEKAYCEAAMLKLKDKYIEKR